MLSNFSYFEINPTYEEGDSNLTATSEHNPIQLTLLMSTVRNFFPSLSLVLLVILLKGDLLILMLLVIWLKRGGLKQNAIM